MPRARSSESRYRLHISLSEKSMQRMERLKELTEADDQGEVIRNALRWYEAVVLARNAGKAVLLQDPQGNLQPADLTAG